MKKLFLALVLTTGLVSTAEARDFNGDGIITVEEAKQFRANYDTDGDGKLSKTERAPLREKAKERRSVVRDKFDADGSGKLNKEERKAAREYRKENRPKLSDELREKTKERRAKRKDKRKERRAQRRGNVN